MLKKSFFDYLFYSILVVIVILFVEGVFNHYHYLFHDFTGSSNWYNCATYYTKHHEKLDVITNLIWFENGIIENLQIVFLILGSFYFYLFLKNNRNINFKLSKMIYVLYFIGLLYYLFEEISWGQHLFKWNTPTLLFELNDQNETNLHNISNLFNQLPRNLILIWCSLTFLLVNFSPF